jgi:hypothetical protein
LSGRITWRVTHPEREPKTEEEGKQTERLKQLMERVRKAVEERNHRAGEKPPDAQRQR